LLVAAGGSAAAILDLTSCGKVPQRTTAVLRNDVSCGFHCSSDETRPCDLADPDASCDHPQDYCVPDSIQLAGGARLRLDGHTIHPAYQGDAVVCGEFGDQGTCFVDGPGTIAGQKGIGIWGRSMNVTLRNLRIDESDAAVITEGKLTASNVVLGDGRSNNLSSGGTMFLRNVYIGGEDRSRSAGNVFVNNVIVHGGIDAGGDVRGSGVLLMRNGIRAENVYLSHVFGENVPGRDGPGSIVARAKLRLVSSTVTGNEAYDGVPDLVSGRRPELIASRCGTSARYSDPTISWNVCRDD
jgi:hypothetical protein